MRVLFLISPFIIQLAIFWCEGYVYNLLYYSIAVLFIGFLLKSSLSIKNILLFGALVVLSFELFSFISFQLKYVNNSVHFVGNEVFPMEMYRDYDNYFDFQFLENSPKNHFKRHLCLFISVCSINFVIFYANIFFNNKLRSKENGLIDQDI